MEKIEKAHPNVLKEGLFTTKIRTSILSWTLPMAKTKLEVNRDLNGLKIPELPKAIAAIVDVKNFSKEQIQWLNLSAWFQNFYRTHNLLKATTLAIPIVEFIQTLLGFLHWRWCGQCSDYLAMPILSLCCIPIVFKGFLDTYDARKSPALKGVLEAQALSLTEVTGTELVCFEQNLVSFFHEMLTNIKCYRIFFACCLLTGMVSLILNFIPSDSPDPELKITLQANAVIGSALLTYSFYRMEKTRAEIQSNLKVLEPEEQEASDRIELIAQHLPCRQMQ